MSLERLWRRKEREQGDERQQIFINTIWGFFLAAAAAAVEEEEEIRDGRL